MSLLPQDKLQLQQMDVKTAFLCGYFEEEIYMDQLEGFSIESRDRCVSLRCQYIDLYKPINNGILTLILLLHLLNLKKTLFIS